MRKHEAGILLSERKSQSVCVKRSNLKWFYFFLMNTQPVQSCFRCFIQFSLTFSLEMKNFLSNFFREISYLSEFWRKLFRREQQKVVYSIMFVIGGIALILA